MKINRELGRKKLFAEITEIAFSFGAKPDDIKITHLTHGNINDTFIVSGNERKFVLQCINAHVFPEPIKVAENSATISKHIQLSQSRKPAGHFPQIIKTLDGENHLTDTRGNVWRAQCFIENSKVYECVHTFEMASQVGRCLAEFHQLIKDLPPSELEITLPGFHNLPLYLQKYDKALAANGKKITAQLRTCLKSVNLTRKHGSFLEDARLKGKINLVVTHGDPKVSNVLFDRNTGDAITLIDLDTVGPGLLLYDIGDCLRSCCCSVGEKEFGGVVRCDIEMIKGMLSGYLEIQDLSSFEKNAVYESLLLVTFELGIRFLTDYIQGNCYFKVQKENDNLRRALLQFDLVESIRRQRDDIRGIVMQISQNINNKGKK